MKKSIILFLLFTSINAFSQKGTIKGIIADVDNIELPGANISVNNEQTGAISNFEGIYYINNLEPGTYTINVSYIGYQSTSKEVSVDAGKTAVVNFTLEAGIELADVIVNARRAGESKAMNSQKNAPNITSIIASEQLERFPDNNIGDALKRIPGINVQYDQGEARFGNIRGTAPELNSITINGERVPSAEAEIRSVQLDLIPSDMIQTVEYNKAVTPDMDADAIGGSVNLVTKTAPIKKELSGKLGTGYNFISEKPNWKGSLLYSQRLLNDKVGIILSASFYDNKMGSDDLEAEWDYANADDKNGSAYTTNIQQRQYFVERMRQSYSVGLDYKLNDNHTFYFKSIYNHRNDWENRFRVEYKDIEWDDSEQSYITEIRRQTKFGVEDNKYARLEDQKMMNYSIGGDHLFGKMKIDWSGTYAKANEERPNERYITYRAKDVLIDIDGKTMEEPAIIFNDENYSDFSDAFELKELTEEFQYTEEIDKNFRLNFEIPLMSGNYSNKIKFGVRYRGKEKNRDNDFYEFEPVDDLAENALNQLVLNNLKNVSKENYMAGDYKLGHFIDPEISDVLDLYNTAIFEKNLIPEELAGNFNAKEDIYAAYFMFTQDINNISVIAGLRAEKTMLDYQGFAYFEDEDSLAQTEKVKDDYINILPGIHIKYALSDNANLRFAWTNTISRPNYFDLVPYQEINDDNEISLGNPNLIPTTSMNFDIMGEYFFNNVGIISAGIFYKDISDVIAYQVKTNETYKGHVYDEYRRPENVGNASLFGLEVGVSRKLDMLPWALKNLTLYGNYTYIKSKLEDITFEGREGEEIPMGGSPTHTLNASIAYDTKAFDIRISYNHASAFLNNNDDGGIGEEAFFDFYYDAVDYLDINADIRINKFLKVYVNANNLLNQPLRTYWGENERTAQAEYYGIKINAGVKFKF